MFISDRFVFLELHKTGCSHIRSILDDVLDGTLVGKHNQAPVTLFNGSRIFLGSVRNPWDWYCSLWAYGCDHRGAVYHSTTQTGQTGENWHNAPIKSFLRLFPSHNAKVWRETYRNANDPGAFRAWLSLMHDPEFALDIDMTYGSSDLHTEIGLLSHRYLTLFCTKEGHRPTRSALNGADVADYEAKTCFIDHFIRRESLESDLIACLEAFGFLVSADLRIRILDRPNTNTSHRKRRLDYYYDSPSIDLIARRDRLIVEKFGYCPQ